MIRSMSRIAPVVLMLAAAGLLTSGCGGSKSASAETSPTATRALTMAQAVTFAGAVNLRTGDLPGWSAGPAPEPQSLTDFGLTVFARCARTRPFRYIARLPSPAFVQGNSNRGAEVVSSVAVAPTASLAATEFAALATARGRSCFERRSRAQRPEDSNLSSEHFSWSSLPLPAAAHGFGVRVTGTLGRNGTRDRGTRAYFDLLAFTSGPAQIFLFASAWGSRPQSITERQLLSLLYGRASAHKLRG
jgi:hypothetical protein